MSPTLTPCINALSPNWFWLSKVNILVNKEGHAQLADFGLLTIVSDPGYTTTSSLHASGGTRRWMSPELIDPSRVNLQHHQPTKESDCYALGMVVLEVLSGQLPFAGCTTELAVQKVLSGEHPGRPKEAWFTDDLWGVLELCWEIQPESRPSIGAVLECFVQASRGWKPPSPSVDGHASSIPVTLSHTTISLLSKD